MTDIEKNQQVLRKDSKGNILEIFCCYHKVWETLEVGHHPIQVEIGMYIRPECIVELCK